MKGLQMPWVKLFLINTLWNGNCRKRNGLINIASKQAFMHCEANPETHENVGTDGRLLLYK